MNTAIQIKAFPNILIWGVVALAVNLDCVAATLTLDDCINIGLKINPTIASKTLELDLDRPTKLAAWGRFLPQITVGYGIDQEAYLKRTYVNPDGSVTVLPVVLPDGNIIPITKGRRRSSQYFFRVNEVLFDGGQNYFNLKNADLRARQRSQSLKAAELNLRADITRAFCDAYASQRRQELADEVVNLKRIQLRYAEIRLAAGSVTRRDLLQAEVDLGRAVADSIAVRVELRRRIENLNLLTGLPVDSVYHLADLPNSLAVEWDADSLFAVSMTEREDLIAQRLEVALSDNEVRIARGGLLPQLSAGFIHSRSEQSGASVPFTLEPRNRSTSLDVTLSWTMFDRLSRSLRIHESKVLAGRQSIAARELERDVRRQVSAAVDNLKSLYAQVAVARDNSRWAEETLKFEQERYRVGSAGILDLSAAQVSYIQARNDQIELESQFVAAFGELERAVGMPLRPSQ